MDIASIEKCAVCKRADPDNKYSENCEKVEKPHCAKCHRQKCLDKGYEDRLVCPGCDFQGIKEDFTEVKREAATGSNVEDVGVRCPKCNHKFNWEYGHYKPQ